MNNLYKHINIIINNILYALTTATNKKSSRLFFLTHRVANIHNARLLVALDVWMYSPVWHFSL